MKSSFTTDTPHSRHRARTGYRESLWREAGTLSKSSVSGQLWVWLSDNGSLTRRLRSRCTGQFRVKIIAQGWEPPLINEAHHLKISIHRWIFRREVVLYCDNRPMVYARTVIPARTLKGRLSRLADLGEKPLGEILFTDPHIQRCDLEIARLRPGELLFENARRTLADMPASIEAIWARRSTFAYHDKKLLVSEIFLPNQEFGYNLNA
ncbi:MAG: chorismate lyase [Gammaproteobacteria bacterium]|nr:chorismate lyase [Gammaproteobacteria bacterium]